MLACLRCFEVFAEWAGLLLRCRCPYCGALMETVFAPPRAEEVLPREY